MKMRRRWLIGTAIVAALAVAGLFGLTWLQAASQPIRVGILHSRTGAMAISESSMIDAEVLALEQINAKGGLLGRKIEWIIEDGKSDWPVYAKKAQKLIDEDKVDVIFGCWTSASRKTTRPIIEERKHLLVYPMAYEGLEISEYMIYTGAAPNQQIIPVVKWSYEEKKARRFFLVGSDYIWPRSVNEIIKDQLKALNAELVGEEYIFFGSTQTRGVVNKIKKANPDVILSAVVGESNVSFYKNLKAAGIKPDKTPVISFSIGEDELRERLAEDVAGHYSAWNYFQCIDRPENQAFVDAFRGRYGKDRVTMDVICASYNSVRLWAQAVEEARTSEVGYVRAAMLHQSLNAPEGVISIDPATHHTWRPVYIAQAQPDGQFKIVWDSKKPIRPVPYPITRTKKQWDLYLVDLFEGWGKSWANPVDQTASE